MMPVSIALTLIAITGGMFLLAKTIKDNLGIIFKVAAYFIIIAAFLNLGCAAMLGMVKMAKHHFYGDMKMHQKHMQYGMYGHHNMRMEDEDYHHKSCNRSCGCGNQCEEQASKRCYIIEGGCRAQKDTALEMRRAK